MAINFRPGLSDTPGPNGKASQMGSVRNLLANKPVDTWNQTDWSNWNYATNNQDPLKAGGKNQQQTKPASNDLQALHDWIDSQPYSAGEKAVLHQIASDDSYTSGQKIPTTQELNQIISDAARNAETDTNPYFTKMTARELEDTKSQLSDIRGGFERYQAKEAADYKTKLEDTKKSLRARGLTFSGTSRATLGSEGALDAQNVEGSVPNARRLDYTGNVAAYQSQANKLGTAAERQLGSAGISDVNFGSYSSPYGDVNLFNKQGNVSTGDLELQRIKAIEQSKWSRIKEQSPFYYR